MLMQNKMQSFIPLEMVKQGNDQSACDERFRNISTLVVKVTHRCNLDCLYCYENITKGEDMSIKTFQALADKALTNTTKRKVTFLFHGGEPTLMSEFWFEEAVSYARSKAQMVGKRAVFTIQSNILALDDKKIQLFHDLGISLSVSFDGPPSLPNAMRKRAKVAFDTYQRLIAAGIKPGILMTINHSNFNYFTEICSWLENSLEVQDFKANVVSSVGAGINLPDMQAEHVFQAYKDILEYMINTKGQKVIEDNLVLELLRFFATPEERSSFPQELCRTKKCGAGDRVLGVTPDGKLLPCGRFQWNDEKYFLGSLFELNERHFLIAFKEAQDQFHDLVPETWLDCETCDARNVCSYGCQAFIVRSKSQANVDCIPTKMRYRYYQENRERLLPIIESIRTRVAKSNRFAEAHFQLRGTNYRDGYSDGVYNDTYNDDKGSYVDTYSDEAYDDTRYSDVSGYDDYSDRL